MNQYNNQLIMGLIGLMLLSYAKLSVNKKKKKKCCVFVLPINTMALPRVLEYLKRFSLRLQGRRSTNRLSVFDFDVSKQYSSLEAIYNRVFQQENNMGQDFDQGHILGGDELCFPLIFP